MKKLLFYLFLGYCLSLFFVGCYTKNQALRKFCKQDTALTQLTLTDTLYVPQIQADTIFTHTYDSVLVVSDRLVIKYLKKDSTIYLKGTCLADTIYKTKTVTVKIPCNCPSLPPPTLWDKAKNWLAFFGLIAILILAFKLNFRGS